MILNTFLQPLSNALIMKYRHLFTTWLSYPFSFEWKIEYKVKNKQTIVQILIVNTAFYIYKYLELV